MKRIHLGLAAGSIAALAACLFVAGCGTPSDNIDDEPLPRKRGSSGATSKVSAPVETLKMVKGDPKGVIKGTVKWEGAEPNLEDMTARLRNGMVNDKGYCLSGKDYETTQQTFRIGKNKGLGNVFVWIAPPPGHAFEVPDSQLPAKKEVRIHQPHCAFVPHCSVVFASRYKNGDQDPTGCQKLVVENDARVGHNSNVTGGPLNGSKNVLLGAWDGKGKIQDEKYDLKPERDAVTVSCGVHAWMKGYVRVFDHPYNVVTSVGADLKDPKKPVWENLDSPEVGTFEIKGAPVGAKVRLFAWHEELGHLLGAQGKEIVIDADASRNAQEILAKGK
jgi:hypothetical protein